MTIKNEDVTKAIVLLNCIDDLAHVVELVAQTVEDNDRLSAAISQLGTIIREKVEAADICLGGPADTKEALKQAIAREMAQCAD